MDHLSALARTGKSRIIGNLIRAACAGPGLGNVLWGEETITPEALGIYGLNDGRLQPFETKELTWRPDRIVARHTLDDLELSERKFAHEDTLVDLLTFRNSGSRPLSLRIVIFSDLEGRKAKATYGPLAGLESAGVALVDLQVSRRCWLAFGTSRLPGRVCWAPFAPTLQRRLAQATGPSIQSRYKQDLLVCGQVFELELAPGESASWTLALTVAPTAAQARKALERPLADGAGCLRAVTDAWQAFFARQVPRFTCSSAAVADVYHYAWFVQQANRVEMGSRRFPWPFAAPAKFKYPHLWFWDACLQAIILRWLRDPAYCEGNLRTVANQQYPDGMLPHETSLLPGAMQRNWPDGDGQSSSVTQPPVFGLALWEVYCATGNRRLLADLWPALRRYDQWFEEVRDPDGDHLFALVHRWETGWDNSPRWDSGFDMEPVDVNALIVIQREVLAQCAEMFGQAELAASYRTQAQQVAGAVRRLMWDAEAGFFCDLDEDNQQSPVRSAAAFVALTAGLAEAEQAEALRRHLLDPDQFWTEFPVPCLARNNPEFVPSDYWRGPVWININWLIVRGLLRYGFRAEAAELVSRTLRLMSCQGPATCNECYNPLSGAEVRTPDLSWSGLIVDLIITCLGGLRPRADGQLECDPLDLGLDSFAFADLPYRGHRIGLAYDRTQGYRVSVDGVVRCQRADLGPIGPLPLE